MTSRHRLPRPLPLATACLLVAMPAEAWESCRHSAERQASVDAAGATSVVVSARAGDLVVQPGAANTLLAHGKACASTEKYLQQTSVSVRRDGTTIRVDVLVPDPMVLNLADASLDLVVEVPAGLPVEITDSSGDLEAHDLVVTKVTDSSGDVLLRNLRGDVEVWDSSGDVRIENAAGRVQVRDSSGDIVIVGAGDVVVASDSSGDMTIRRVRGSVTVEQDSSGDIRIADVGQDVAVLGDSSGAVEVSAVQGRVKLPD